MNQQHYYTTELLNDCLRLVQAISEQSRDNPKMAENVLGKAITKEAHRLLDQLHLVEQVLRQQAQQ